VLLAVVLLVAAAAVVFAGGDHAVPGSAVAAKGPGSTPTVLPPSTSQTPVAPLTPKPGWSTLSNPASGLSYQIPPTMWSTNPDLGTVGPVTLAQGAERTAYTCGKPLERLLRGVLGSGSAPRADPGDLAVAIAQAAAMQYYSTGNTLPKVTIGAAQPVLRKTKAGKTVVGALVLATVTQHADPCLASRGEVLAFVLPFPDHDGVLLVNADVAGGPASPAPATDSELRAIVATAYPTS
jgi:hypothetical protein